MTISGFACTIFLQMLTDFLGTSGEVSRINYYIMENIIKPATTAIKPACICNKVKGYGDMKSLSTIKR